MSENDSLSDQEPECVSFSTARTQLTDSEKKIAVSLEQAQKKRKERNRQIDLKLKEQSKKKKEQLEQIEEGKEEVDQMEKQIIPITRSTLLAQEIANSTDSISSSNSTKSFSSLTSNSTHSNSNSKNQLAAQAKAFLKRSLSKNPRKRILY